MENTKKVYAGYSVDRLATGLWRHLARDFRELHGGHRWIEAERLLGNNISSFRDYVFPEMGHVHPSLFKANVQLDCLLKKFRFQEDKYTDQELEQRTFDKYFEEQLSISVQKPRTILVQRVLGTARRICRELLGSLDLSELPPLGRFGRKSSIGCPYAVAYIDHKLTNVKAFTGSIECSRWFKENVVNSDAIIRELVSALEAPNLEHESLTLVNVPKSWKIDRTITPLTLLALFYSYSVGELVSNRLSKHGLDIRRLQERHRHVIRDYSRSCSHATADLSHASDSLTTWLLNAVIPRQWYNAIKKTFTHKVMVNSKLHYTESVLPMGNGLTFPVETLVFYSIIKAIGTLANEKGRYSVYGDDLIYPSRLHKYVVRVFDELGLVLNLDKTFVHFPFRESCGSDYYMGFDVRPYYFPRSEHTLGKQRYAALLYKVINGLCRRWDPHEIPHTLRYLGLCLADLNQPILRVPPSFPDYSGLRVDVFDECPWWLDSSWMKPVRTIFLDGSRWFSFTYLQETADRRVVRSQLPYLWLSLQSGTDVIGNEYWTHSPGRFLNEADEPQLSWRRVQYVRTYKDNKGRLRKRVCYKEECTCASKTQTRISLKTVPSRKTRTGSISDWI